MGLLDPPPLALQPYAKKVVGLNETPSSTDQLSFRARLGMDPGLIAFRLQTHNGDKVPLGMYKDTGMTLPANKEGDVVLRWRDEITGSGLVVALNPGALNACTLRFVDGVPVIRAPRFDIPSQPWFPGKRGSVYLVAKHGVAQPTRGGFIDTFGRGAANPVWWYARSAALLAPSSFYGVYDGSNRNTNKPDRGWETRALVRSADSSWQFWRKGLLDNTATATNAQPSNSVAANDYPGDLIALCYSVSGVYSPATNAYLRTLMPPVRPYHTVIYVAGNSLSTGQGGSDGYSYPEKLDTLIADPMVEVVNWGIAGQTTTQMASNAANTLDVWPDATRRRIVVAWEITNALYFGDSADPAYADQVAFWQARKAAGAYVVAPTVLPRNDVGTPAGFEAARLTVNTNIRANWTNYADAICDLAVLPELDDCTDATYFNADLVHLKNTGYEVVGTAVKASIDRIPWNGLCFGAGSPEGVVKAPVGTIYRRTDGGAATSYYVKESGTGITGWVAK